MAANSRSLKAGKAFIEFSLKDGKVRDQLRKLQKRFAAVGSSLQMIGGIGIKTSGAIATAFAGTVKVFTSVGDNLDKMAARTGFSVESLSQLGFAAEQSGSDLGTLEKSVRKMQATLLMAERGGAAAKDTLADLGLKFSELKNLTPEAQLKLLSDRLAGVEDPTKRAALAMQLFGGSGQKLLPLLSGGAAGMEKLQAEAHGLGLTISGETAASAAALADKFNIVKKVLTRVAVAVGEALSPALQDAADWITKNVVGIIDWVKINREVIASIAKWTGILGAGSVALIALGSAFNVAAIAVGALNTTFVFLLANPVVAALALVAAGIGYIAFESLRASDAIGGIDDAIRKLERKRTDGNADDLRAMTTRFEQLAAKTELTTAEQKEARKIMHALRVEYGELAAGIDRSTGKITKSQKTLAQLRAAQTGQSIAAIGMQISLEELAIDSMKAKGAAVDDIAKREQRLAKLRDKLKLTNAIVADAKPFESPKLPDMPDTTLPPVDGAEEGGKQAGEEFGQAFLDLVRAKANLAVDLMGDAIQFGADGIDSVLKAAREGADAARVQVDISRGDSGTFSALQAQLGFVDSEQNRLLSRIAKTNDAIARKMGEGGLPVA